MRGVWSSLRSRGSRVYWADFASFHRWAIDSGYRPGLHLTRTNPRAGHGPTSCAWLPPRESWEYRRPKKATRNPQRNVRAFGETKGVADWARDPRCVVTAAGLSARLKRGIPPAKAITGRKRRDADYHSEKAIRAWGVEKPIAAWARDRRAQVGAQSIRKRLLAGWHAEAAIATAAFRQWK